MAAGGSWSLYRDYTFGTYSNAIVTADSGNAQEVAEYMRQNPTYQVGIDGSSDAHVKSVRDALLAAGVPAHRIHIGGFGDPQLRRDNRVAVLFSN